MLKDGLAYRLHLNQGPTGYEGGRISCQPLQSSLYDLDYKRIKPKIANQFEWVGAIKISTHCTVFTPLQLLGVRMQSA